MTKTLDWQRNKEMWVRVLQKQTGEGVAEWNRPDPETALARGAESSRLAHAAGCDGLRAVAPRDGAIRLPRLRARHGGPADRTNSTPIARTSG